MNTDQIELTTRLAELETVIERGLQTFVEVGNALMEIRDGRLYLAEHDTFEDYCRGRWGLKRQRAYELMGAASVVNNLSEISDKLPARESHAAALASLPIEQQRDAWTTALETAPNGKPTAAHIERTIEDYNYKRDNKSSAPRYTPQGLDACQTPAYALDPLAPYLPDGCTVWEPACGEGLLEDALFDSGFQVVSGDLQAEQDFFEYEPEYDCQVTNPPFSKKFPWLKRCYELGKPFALLLPVETLGAKAAQQLFDQFGIEVIFMDKRINFKMPYKGFDGGGAQFPVAWFTWGLNIGQQMTFKKVIPQGEDKVST